MFEVECSVEPAKDQVWIVGQQPAFLHYTIRNITEQPPPETQFGTMPTSGKTTPTSREYRLGYEVCVDKGAWSLQDPTQGQGTLEMPRAQLTSQLLVTVVPSGSGSLPVPRLLLKWVPADTAGGEGCVLTDAQVYEVSRGQTVTVHTSSSAGR